MPNCKVKIMEDTCDVNNLVNELENTNEELKNVVNEGNHEKISIETKDDTDKKRFELI